MARRLSPLSFLLCAALSAAPPPSAPSAAGNAPESPAESGVQGLVCDPKGVPLAEAQVVLEGGSGPVEMATRVRGTFRLPALPPGTYRLQVSKEGYEPRTRSFTVEGGRKAPHLKIVLHRVAGTTVEVFSSAVSKVEPHLREDIIPTETLQALEIRKSNAASLNEAVDCKPGISVQTECSICNVRNVVLNNLPGRFTTIMIDGVPIFSSVSGAYGLDMIGVNGVETIEVSRGAGVSLIAPEALAGTVNLISKRPTEEERILEAQGGSFGYQRLDAFWAHPMDGGALTFSAMVNNHDSVDGNGNRVSEYTGYKRNLAGLGFFVDSWDGFSLRGRLDAVDERRGGGALGFDHDGIKADLTGNPFDWSQGRGGSPDGRGWIRPDGDFNAALAHGQNPILLPDGRVLIPYDGGRGGFSEIIDTKRYQGILVAERDLGASAKWKLAFGGALHRQDSFYEGDFYKADQKQFYAESSVQWFLGDTLLTGGLNLRYEDLRSKGILVDGTHVEGLDNYTYQTPAAFVQLYHGFLGGLLELNGSLRVDRNNVFGDITTPRLNLLWHHTPQVSSRFAVGRGFRVPTSFFEQDHGVLATTRIDRIIDRPELSDNASYTFSAGGERLSLVLSASYNRIRNYALLDSGAADPVTGEPITLFTQATHPVTVKGVDGTLTARLVGHLQGTLGAEHYAYDFEPGTLSFARPAERVYLRFDYDNERWNLLARGTWTGPMDLRRFYDYEHTPRFNMDGAPKLDRSPAYWVADVSASYKLNKTAAVVVMVNNVFDFKQTDREDFLWLNAQGKSDVTQLWGPGRGRSIQAGLRFTF